MQFSGGRTQVMEQSIKTIMGDDVGLRPGPVFFK